MIHCTFEQQHFGDGAFANEWEPCEFAIDFLDIFELAYTRNGTDVSYWIRSTVHNYGFSDYLPTRVLFNGIPFAECDLIDFYDGPDADAEPYQFARNH